MSAVQSAYNCRAKAIVALTNTGRTAREAAKYRPTCPILAVTRDAQVARQLQLHRGIIPMHYAGKFFFKKMEMSHTCANNTFLGYPQIPPLVVKEMVALLDF